MRVFVLDRNKRPLDPCRPARARKLLKAGRAAVIRRYPFTIVLKDRTVEESVTHGHRIKLDPGSRVTGMAVLQEETKHVVWAAELHHRGWQVKKALDRRSRLRRSRRLRKCRYRKPRFLNRRRPKGRLSPSLQSRVDNVQTWVDRLRRSIPVSAISVELAKFDTQKMQNPEISGAEYRQGELFGYEVRQYLLDKFNRRCVYCKGRSGDPVLEIEHIIPRKRGGSNRVSNLVIACRSCNREKGCRTAEEYGHPEVQEQARRPLRDAAIVNTTRWAIYRRLRETGLPVEVGTGGRTKFNRRRLELSKSHWVDAACVGASTPETLIVEKGSALLIRARGHGKRQRCGTDKYGFPFRHAPRAKRYLGFQTGDIVKAVVPRGKYAGTHVGCLAIRFRPWFRLNGFDVHPKHLALLQRADGYEYGFVDPGKTDSLPRRPQAQQAKG